MSGDVPADVLKIKGSVNSQDRMAFGAVHALGLSRPIVSGAASVLTSSSLIVLSASAASDQEKSLEIKKEGLVTLRSMVSPKNLNGYWIGLTTLAVWFLFIHSPPKLAEFGAVGDAPFMVHLIGAYTIYCVCIFNSMFTPSTLNGKARFPHVVFGRIGMIAGFVSFALGAYCAWWPGRGEKLPPLSFSVAITIGGCFQIIGQIFGYWGIRKFQSVKRRIEDMESAAVVNPARDKAVDSAELADLKEEKETALKIHVYNMVSLFAVACGAPAAIRLLGAVGIYGVVAVVGAIMGLNFVVGPYGSTFFKEPPNDTHTASSRHEPLLRDTIESNQE